jgi:hypothetical protein
MGFLTLRSSSMKPLSRILFKPFVLYLDLFHEYCQYLDEKREFIWKIQDSNIEKIKGSNQSRFNDFAVFFRRQTSLLDFLSS